MKNRLFLFIGFIVFVLIASIVAYYSLYSEFTSLKTPLPDGVLSPVDSQPLTFPILAGLVSLALSIFYFFSVTKRENENVEQQRVNLKNEEKELVQELKANDTDFATLWSLTQSRIDYYHQIATNQARRSFVSTQVATVGGFILIISVGVIASQADSPVAAISAGSVGVVGGSLSAYIGATFMKSQTEATAQLRQFFMQPVEFSRILGAERLLDNLEPEEKSKAVQQIIRSIIFTQTYGDEKKEP
jgi:hypothetical protein